MAANAIVVIFDACRQDALEPYGAPSGASPTVADLAGRGSALEEVYATASWTAPSHASIFTGKMPRALGLAAIPSGKHPDVMAQMEVEHERLLPVVFQRAGYRTIAASANLWVAPHCGFGIGVDEFIEVHSQRQKSLSTGGVRARMRGWKEAVSARVDDGAAEIKPRLIEALTRSREPFFCFVNLIECHSPYLPPKPYAIGSPLERIRVANEAREHLSLDAVWRTNIGGMEVSPDTLQRFRRQYAASIRYMDDWLADLLDALDRSGQLDDTVVVVTADHGENFGECGLISHGNSLDNRLLNVPFVTAGPGTEDRRLCSLAGLPGFLAGCVEMDRHPWAADDLPEGVGLAQLDPVAGRDDPRIKENVIDRWGLGEDAVRRLTTPMTCAIGNRRKLLVRGNEELWVDLDSDPLEANPIPISIAPAEDSESITKLRGALRHPSMTAERPFKLDEAPAASEEELRDLEDRMKLLGYL